MQYSESIKKLVWEAVHNKDDEYRLRKIAYKLSGYLSTDGGVGCLEFWENTGKFGDIVLPVALRYAPKLEVLRTYVSFHERIKEDPDIYAMFKGKLVEHYTCSELLTDDDIRALMILSYADLGGVWLKTLYDRKLFEEVYVICVGLHPKRDEMDRTSKLIFKRLMSMRMSDLKLDRIYHYMYDLDLKQLFALEYED